ncbi:MAG TPA: hypothetical protein VFA26_21620 [Gemmataceae bacterium]|nr:hypothetical protein [Gemmataceae bacterium]
MPTKNNRAAQAARPEALPQPITKKDQILELYVSGVTDVKDLALFTGSKPSYVASVLHGFGQAPAYFDLYTSTRQPMNVYSQLFAGRLGYRDVAAARQGVALLDQWYQQFGRTEDRAGQHHTMMLALIMFNRARWSNKPAEAAVYRDWLEARLHEAAAPPPEEPKAKPVGRAVRK